jgi:hypothetical protein
MEIMSTSKIFRQFEHAKFIFMVSWYCVAVYAGYRVTYNGPAIKLVNVAERLEAVTIKALVF